jgi:spore coat protein CotF
MTHNNTKQTAVEWLIEQCPRIETIVAYNILEQAKAMEKQQIIDAHSDGQYPFFNAEHSEQYYNQTYKTQTP